MVASNSGLHSKMTDSKLDAVSLDSVPAGPGTYSMVLEPPPAYSWKEKKSLRFARLIALTVVAVAALLGAAIVLAAYIQSKGSTAQIQVEHAPLTAAGNHESSDPDSSEASDENPHDGPGHLASVLHQRADESDESGEENNIEDSLNLDELADAIMERVHGLGMNCIIDKFSTEDPERFFTKKKFAQPKIARVIGEKLAVICDYADFPEGVPFGFPFYPPPPPPMFHGPVPLPVRGPVPVPVPLPVPGPGPMFAHPRPMPPMFRQPFHPFPPQGRPIPFAVPQQPMRQFVVPQQVPVPAPHQQVPLHLPQGNEVQQEIVPMPLPIHQGNPQTDPIMERMDREKAHARSLNFGPMASLPVPRFPIHPQPPMPPHQMLPMRPEPLLNDLQDMAPRPN